MHRRLHFAVILLLVAPAAGQQWATMETKPFARTASASAIDPRSGRMLLFGGSGAPGPAGCSDLLWQWTGRDWIRLGYGSAPPSRIGAAMALDTGRGRVVLFGGSIPFLGQADDTWEWDGSDWLQRTPATRPPPSVGHSLAFDPVRGRTVAFGGNNPWTFEWDGGNWSQVATPVTPIGRQGGTLAFDAVRQRVALFGGVRGTIFPPIVYLNDLWEFDGATWAPVAVAGPQPPGRAYHAAAWDAGRNRLVVHGGENGFLSLLSDTWEWDGFAWHAMTTVGSPPAQWSLAMNYDAAQQRVVMAAAGFTGGTSSASTWQWVGSTWITDGAVHVAPTARTDHGFVEATGGRCLLFGGAGRERHVTATFGDTWLWHDGGWTRAQPTTVPQARYGFGLACDRARNRVVMFGGINEPYTWEWDGTTWLPRLPAVRPPPRSWNAMAWDATRGVTVLFGGVGGIASVLGDAWAWNGVNWTSIATGPPARWGHTMTFDATRQRVVMHGGSGLNDLWEWNGSLWTLGVAPPGPARPTSVLFHDPLRQRIVLHGGGRPDSWEWDGVVWTPIAAGTSLATSSHCAAFDPVLGRVLVFDGTEMWTSTASAATAAVAGDPCPGVTGLPVLLAAGRPYIGNRAFQLWLDGAPSQALAAAFLDWNAALVPLPGSCRSLLAQPHWFSFGICDAGGGLLLPMPLAGNTALRGLRLHVQGLAVMAGGPLLGTFVPTARLEIFFGD